MKKSLLICFFISCFLNVYSAVTITSTPLIISTCTFPSSYSNLGNISIFETVAFGDFGFAAASTNYTLTLTAPANFQFNPGIGAVGFNAPGDITAASISVLAGSITITYQSAQLNRTNGMDILNITGIQVQAITAYAAQNITKTGGTGIVAGLPNATNIVLLTSQAFAVAPTITTNPSSVTTDACAGNSAVFNVVAGLNGPFTYQWQKGGVNLANGGAISGVTTTTLTITPVVAGDVGNYTCIVTDCGGSTTSAIGVLTFVNSCTGPGGVTANLQTWVRADIGVTGTTPITAWANQKVTGTPVLVNGAPNLSNATSYNYNPFVDFTAPAFTLDGAAHPNRQFLKLSGLNVNAGNNYGALFFAFHLTDLTRVNTHIACIENITFAIPAMFPNGTLHGQVFAGSAAMNDGAYDTDFSATAAAGTWKRNTVNIDANTIHSSTKHVLAANDLVAAGVTTLNRFLGGQVDQSPATSFAGHPRDWRGPAAEVIGYSVALTPVEQNRVQSYLGIKYGVTYPTSYIHTGGALVFATAAPYNNNIIGIGRDDIEVLTQKQSHNDDDVVRIYLSTLTVTNALNTGTFTNNISYVMTGANTGAMCATAGSNSEKPASCGLFSRIEREWKVTRTNMAQNFNMDFRLSACAAPGSVNVADLRLLVDDDGNFAAGVTNCYSNATNPGLFTYTNPTITVTGITATMIPDGTTRFITIGSVNAATPLPVELVEFNAQLNNSRTVDLTWSTATEINNDYFEIERSAELSYTKGIAEWQTIETIDGAGNSTVLLNYSTVDTDPYNWNNYYRLKQVDFDGAIKYSDIRIVSLEGKEDYMLFPNPANSTFSIRGNDIDAKEIRLMNSLGKEVVLPTLASSSNLIQFDIDTMSDGLYYVQIKTEKEVIIQKLVIKR